MERTEAPTEERLAELRSKGIVPYSPFSTRCVGCAAVLLSLFAVRTELKSMLAFYRGRLLHSAALPEFAPLVPQFVSILCVPLAALIVATFAWGVVQTKFLLVFSQLGLNAGRMQKGPQPQLSDLIAGSAGTFLASAVAICVSVGASYVFSYAVMELLNLGPAAARHWAESVFASVSPLVVMVFFFLAVLSWLLARVRFFRRYRMTRKEVEHGVE